MTFDRRAALRIASAALAGGIAGCTRPDSEEAADQSPEASPNEPARKCGQGELTIVEIAERAERTVEEFRANENAEPSEQIVLLRAEIESVEETKLVVTDSTGRAELWPLLGEQFDTTEFEAGTCTGGQGVPLSAPDDPNVDVILIVNPG